MIIVEKYDTYLSTQQRLLFPWRIRMGLMWPNLKKKITTGDSGKTHCEPWLCSCDITDKQTVLS